MRRLILLTLLAVLALGAMAPSTAPAGKPPTNITSVDCTYPTTGGGYGFEIDIQWDGSDPGGFMAGVQLVGSFGAWQVALTRDMKVASSAAIDGTNGRAPKPGDVRLRENRSGSHVYETYQANEACVAL